MHLLSQIDLNRLRDVGPINRALQWIDSEADIQFISPHQELRDAVVFTAHVIGPIPIPQGTRIPDRLWQWMQAKKRQERRRQPVPTSPPPPLSKIIDMSRRCIRPIKFCRRD